MKILQEAKARGIETSIDLVSENSDRYSLVIPCLPYVDNLIINETEAGKLCGMEPTPDNLPQIAEKLLDMGVRQRVIIHMPSLGLCKTRDSLVTLPSVALPKGYIKGKTGAGDAFCSGVLYGAWKGMNLKEAIELATASAACSLSEAGATEGMRPVAEVQKLYQEMR